VTATFDYHELAARLNIPPQRLAELESLVRRQYGRDEMLVELRMLRTLRAIEDGALRLDQALVEFRKDASAPAARSA
jgi:hypothetical protein